MSIHRGHSLQLLPESPAYFVDRLIALQRRLREVILRGSAHGAENDIVREGETGSAYSGDTIYRIDERGEAALLEFCEDWSRSLDHPFVLIAEGLPGAGRMTFPAGAPSEDASFECIVDPIDGTRGLMYGKRSAWALSGIAPGHRALGRAPTLSDIVVAVQSELPTARARLADVLWATAGAGVDGVTLDLVTSEERPLRATPSRASGLSHGFATISKFFPGSKVRASWIEERLFAAVVGDHAGGAPLVFDDEYISSGGQLYELVTGHDRFVADLRPELMDATGLAWEETGGAAGTRRLCARPYDLCTALIAEEAGVIVTDAWGRPLSAPLDTESDVSWCGYANVEIHALVEPVLQRLLREIGAPRR